MKNYFPEPQFPPPSQFAASSLDEKLLPENRGMVAELNARPQNTGKNAPITASENIRPPTIGTPLKRLLSFDTNSITKDYYAPMRALGYAAGVLVDMAKESISFLKKWDANKIAKAEAVVFAGLTMRYAWEDLEDLKGFLRHTVAAEQGRPAGKVEMSDFSNSDNPLIQTAYQRFVARQVIRLSADATFWKGLHFGLLGMAARITLERTVFNQKDAFELLHKVFEDTQNFGFDVTASNKISRVLANVIQQSQKDHGRAPWTYEVMTHYQPLFDQLGDMIAQKQVGIGGATFILGDLITRRPSLEDSLALTQQIKQFGLDNLRTTGMPHALEFPEKERVAAQPEPVVAQSQEQEGGAVLPQMQGELGQQGKSFGRTSRDQMIRKRSFAQMAEPTLAEGRTV
jgi:hypothetical protein